MASPVGSAPNILLKHLLHFGFGENHSHPLVTFGPHSVNVTGEFNMENMAIEKKQCAQRLILGGRSHV